MNNRNEVITPQFQIYNLYDKNNVTSETLYEFNTRYIKQEFLPVISDKIDNWRHPECKWIIGPEKSKISRETISFSIPAVHRYTPVLSSISKKSSTEELLTLAINITEKYSALHSRSILNRSVKSENILISSNNIKIILSPINFFCDIFYGKEAIPEEEYILNDLIYLAPEHFNNEEIFTEGEDEIYSLGVIFYELFTGITPFKSTEYDELIYSHLFREPVQMSNFNLDITPEISEVISKMLKKSPNDRYLTYSGLLYDLGLCKKALSDFKRTKQFIPGSKDIPRYLRIPDKLYGREKHSSQLVELFNESRHGKNNVVFISGPSGIGKTSLIIKTIKPLITTSGIFITGKCENRTKNIPYEPLVKALNQLIKPILMESDEIQNIWKESIINAAGNNGRIVTELIPAVQQLIGEQPPLPNLSGEENRNRINIVMSKFLNVFVSATRVFVLFIDDMQWIDNATLSLLKFFLSSKNVKSFLLVGTYRDNEISEFHNFNIFRNDILSSGISCNDIRLHHLDITGINQMIMETIKAGESESLTLAGAALKYTKGNPLYLKEFLFTIFKKGILKFDEESGWQWNVEQILNLYESEDIVTTMESWMKNLSEPSITVLKYAACIGTAFDAPLLSEITGYNENLIQLEIDNFISEGFIETNGTELKFIHDRVHEAAEAIITNEEKAVIHHKIGLFLINSMTDDQKDDNIFIIANHLNAAYEKLNFDEKISLIEINFLAGEKAKRTVAYELALTSYYRAIEAANECNLDNNGKIRIYHECFVCEYLTNNFEKAYELFELLMQLSETGRDKVRIFNTNVLLLMNRSKPEMAIEMGLIGLKLLGIKLSKNPGRLEIYKEYMTTKLWLHKKDYNSILSMDSITDENILSAMEIMYTLWLPAYAFNHNLMKLLSLKMANITLKHGLCGISPFAFITLGMIFGSGKGSFKAGYDFGLMALQMNEDNKNKNKKNEEIECVINFFFAAFHAQWLNRYDYAIPFFRRARELGTKHGIIYYSRLNKVFYTAARLLQGIPLDQLMKESLEQINSMHLPGNAHWYAIMAMIKNIFYVQEGDTDFYYKNMQMDDKEFINSLKMLEVKQPLHWFTVFRSKALLIFKKFDESFLSMETAESVVHWHFASSIIPEHRFVQSLAIINRTIRRDIFNSIKYMIILQKNIRYLKKCSRACPENYLHKYLLVLAEKNKRRKGSIKSAYYYDMAAIEAKKTGLINDLALIYDLQAAYSSDMNMNESRSQQLKNAYHYYKQWGAHKKAEEMEINYPFLSNQSDAEAGADRERNEKSLSVYNTLDEILVFTNEPDFFSKSKKISEILYNNGIGDRIFFLVKNEESFEIRSELSSAGFRFYETPGRPDSIYSFDIDTVLEKLNSGETVYGSRLEDALSSRSSFYAALPLFLNKKMELFFLIEKNKTEFSEIEKKFIRILKSIFHIIAEKGTFTKQKISDPRKDVISSNFNDLLVNRLFKIMEQDKIFLTEDLTLTMLAKEIEVSPQQLSEYINNNLNMNFNTFINRYRIDEAKRILIEDPERPVLNIAYDIGFNSISVFYNAFIKFEGTPPAKYRKTHMQEKMKNP